MLHNILKRSLFASVVISFVLFWADELNEQLNFLWLSEAQFQILGMTGRFFQVKVIASFKWLLILLVPFKENKLSSKTYVVNIRVRLLN